MILRIIIILFILSFLSCASENTDIPLFEKDLLEFGIPITLQAPDSVEVKTMDFGVQKDITVRGQDWYNLQIFSSTTSTSDMSVVKSDYLSIINDNPYFRNMILEDDDGFIFELEVDSLQSYDFRHIKIQGDREYVFQAGMFGTYSLDEIEKLYQVAVEAR